jgi:O-antigen/teichoic acid export membrane protein
LKRKFVTNLALLLFLNLLVKPVYAFGIDVGVQNAVGAQAYGNYFILLNFSLIFQIILDLGIENFTRSEIARHVQLLNKYFSNILPLKIILGLIYYLVCCIIGYFLNWHFNEFRLLLMLLFNQILASFILYCRANLGGLHHFRADSVISVVDRIVVILICGILLLNPVTRAGFRIEWLIYAQTVAYLITASIAFGLVFSRAHPIHFRFNLKYYLSFLRRSLPYALLILLMATYMRIDSVMLGKLLVNGKEQAGIYAQSFRIIEILSNYGYLFTIILLPVFSRMIQHGESVANLTRLSFTLMFVPALTVAFGCLSYRYDIIDFLYNEHIQHSGRVFGILIFSFLGICTTYIFGTLLTANGSLRQLNTMAAIAVTLNLSLNLILIRRFGVFGAATASMVTQLFTSVYQVILVKKIFRFNTDFKLLLRLAVFIVLIGISSILIRELPIKWIYSFGLYMVAGAILSLVTGLLNLRAVFKVVISTEAIGI